MLCTGPADLDDADRRALLDAARDADAVVGRSPAGGAALLVRSTDIGTLALLRLRGDGQFALRDATRRLRQSKRTLRYLALGKTVIPRAAARDSATLAVGRRIAESLIGAAHLTGLASRTHRNLEVWSAGRRADRDRVATHCPLCGADAQQQVRIPLRTSADLRPLGVFSAVLCTRCAVAHTSPAPASRARMISADVDQTSLSAGQRALMRRFIRQRVARVRPLLPMDRRPRVADIGGGACAFANALAEAGCDVLVFEPNPTNARFANTAAGVQFVADPFDATSAEGIADGSLDGITMWHSLEHVPDPPATLALARRLLRPGGVLYICVPNLDSLQADVGGTHWCYTDIPHHVTHFTPEGLAAVMRKAGFGTLTPHWWNEEYAVFGWYQTLLNLITGSHNYFYNRAKKGRQAEAGPVPAWTRAATTAGPLLLPVAALAAWWESTASKPACAELHGVAE